MGSGDSKVIKPLTKFDIDIVCDKIYHHLILQRDRKINELASKERELREKMKGRKRNYEEVALDVSILVNCFKYIKAAKIIIRYCQIIKDRSNQIVNACKTQQFSTIRELVPYFEGIVWASDKLNLSYIKEFNQLLYTHFGPQIFNKMKNFQFVDKELMDCFSTVEPSPYEIQEYLRKFLQRYQIDNFEWPQGMAPQGGNYYQQPQQVPPQVQPQNQPAYPQNYQQQYQTPPSPQNQQPVGNYPNMTQTNIQEQQTPTQGLDNITQDNIDDLINSLSVDPKPVGEQGKEMGFQDPIPPQQQYQPPMNQYQGIVAKGPMQQLDPVRDNYTEPVDPEIQPKNYDFISLEVRIQELKNVKV